MVRRRLSKQYEKHGVSSMICSTAYTSTTCVLAKDDPLGRDYINGPEQRPSGRASTSPTQSPNKESIPSNHFILSISSTNMHLTTLTAALPLLTLAAAENICSPGFVGVGIAPSTATDTHSVIADSSCKIIDSRLGHGELCGVYNKGSKVTCVNQDTVTGVTAFGVEYGNCVPVNDQVCHEQPGYRIQWCCRV